MKKMLTKPALHVALAAVAVGGLLTWSGTRTHLEASSHREAPLIAQDPLADNTDLYVFRSPDAANNDANATVTIIANYIPFELPQGGPNFDSFGENIRYEIHVKNNAANTTGDDITYRFTFTRTNQDPTTFFRIRLAQENIKTTYKLEQSIAGAAFTTLIAAGTVPAPNIGPRSINGGAGLNMPNTPYETYAQSAISTTAGGIKVLCAPRDDAFFTDLGAIFDLGGVRTAAAARDGLARKNVHSIIMQIPVTTLAKTGTAALTSATNILDSNYIIGVWASASRPAMRTLNTNGTQTYAVGTTVAPTTGVAGSPDGWVQISRIGMPLTNEVVQAIGLKDEWNAGTPYGRVTKFDAGAMNPELGLYMADNTPANGAAPKPAGQTYYGENVPGFGPLRIQTKSLAGLLPASTGLSGGFDFRNGAPGLAPIYGNALTNGTALAPSTANPAGFGEYLLNNGQSGAPRSVDLLPIFHTGVPNLIPYQLATGKSGGNPLTAGKPFINNFLPTFGDMLRINMAVPPTSRTSADFSSEGLLAAAVLGLTDARYNTSTAVQNIPNMDGFPNGRRLEDDVTRIELQAVGGVVLAAIGLWYDDYTVGTSTTPVTTQLGNVLGFSTNIVRNDTTFRAAFPYAQTPWSGTTAQRVALAQIAPSNPTSGALAMASVYPNPVTDQTTLRFELGAAANINVQIRDIAGRLVATIPAKNYPAGVTEVKWQPESSLAAGQYIATVYAGKTLLQSLRIERRK